MQYFIYICKVSKYCNISDKRMGSAVPLRRTQALQPEMSTKVISMSRRIEYQPKMPVVIELAFVVLFTRFML